ncbi:oligosaccharide repeat unit polymerase [Marinilabilia salmonicolor]|uniref:Uncharacterized protein n=1 Tax=Marinilabilia salmonicolor TaxID=989 RepID=A0A368UMQ4_9BACT|nr:oligosaccharide repeat unit polymerase [Marinilabilia salmonicolor]RCW30039.1 hypothetical protein DFO77_12451 [Marinilabilia salmonicolor]
MGILLIIIFNYGVLIYSFFKQKTWLFVEAMLLFILFYDFLFIKASYVLCDNLVYILKSWQEYFLLITVLFILLRYFFYGNFKIKITKENVVILLLIFLSIYSGLVGFFSGKNLLNMFLSWRSFLLPVLLFILIAKSSRLQNLPLKRLNKFLLIIGFFITGHSIIQFFFFAGDLSSLWFYDYFDKIKDGFIDKSYFNFIRDNKLRATSFYVSPLIFSMVQGLFFLLSFFNFLFKKKIAKVIYLLLSLFFGYGIYLSNTRIGIIMLFIGIFCGLLIYYFPKIKISFVILVPILGVLFTFLMLIFGVVGDLSALGRLKQYVDLYLLFTPLGYGLADLKVTTYYDSWYISILFLFGIFALIYILVHYLLINELFSKKINFADIHEQIIWYTTVSYAFSFIYIFAFQYTIGGPPLLLLYLLIQIVKTRRSETLALMQY